MSGVRDIDAKTLEGIDAQRQLDPLAQRCRVRRLKNEDPTRDQQLSKVSQHQFWGGVKMFEHFGEDDDIVRAEVQSPSLSALRLVKVEPIVMTRGCLFVGF